jgi:hypothetical protein
MVKVYAALEPTPAETSLRELYQIELAGHAFNWRQRIARYGLNKPESTEGVSFQVDLLNGYTQSDNFRFQPAGELHFHPPADPENPLVLVSSSGSLGSRVSYGSFARLNPHPMAVNVLSATISATSGLHHPDNAGSTNLLSILSDIALLRVLISDTEMAKLALKAASEIGLQPDELRNVISTYRQAALSYTQTNWVNSGGKLFWNNPAAQNIFDPITKHLREIA